MKFMDGVHIPEKSHSDSGNMPHSFEKKHWQSYCTSSVRHGPESTQFSLRIAC